MFELVAMKTSDCFMFHQSAWKQNLPLSLVIPTVKTLTFQRNCDANKFIYFYDHVDYPAQCEETFIWISEFFFQFDFYCRSEFIGIQT